jgi:hypothetical protein
VPGSGVDDQFRAVRCESLVEETPGTFILLQASIGYVRHRTEFFYGKADNYVIDEWRNCRLIRSE